MRAPSPCPPERLVVAAALHEIAHAESARVRAHIETCPSCAGVFARRGAPAILAGKYEVERELGSGGMGRVLLARHMKLNRRVAIKMLHADRVREPRIVERFAREARAAASLRTRHVVHVLDVDESENGEPFMVMEMLSGVDLDDKIAHEGPLPVDVAVRWVIQACEALSEAHAAGLVHRDIKPANLFLVEDGHEGYVKVLDFGLVKELRSVPFGGPQGTTLTRKGDLLGSPRFMSPEQFGGEVDHRTDIWSLGVTLYMLLSDEAPFEASGLTELQEAITSGRSIPLSVRRGGVPPALEEVIARCLQVRPEARWQTARDLARALEPFAVATPSEPGRRRLGGAAVPFELGRYTVVKRIAAGGMGTVYLGRARGAHGFSRPVAIKQLHAHLAEDADTRRRFLAEARVASRIDHPHVVKVLDVVEDDEQVFLVLDYVQGETFQHLLRTSWEHGKFVPLAVVSAVIAQTAEALHSAHEAPSETGAKLEIVHRDVSPHNILVGQQGAAYVTDFGIAKVREQAAETRNAVLGKTGYMAPEQLRGERVTRAADIFALGVTLWEALTNQALFPTLEERLRVENGPHAALAAAPSAFNPEVSRALDALVMQMLARDPAARPKTALEVAQRLRAEVPPAPADVVSAWIASLARESDDRAPGAPGPTASIERPVLVADLPDTVEAPPTPVLAAPVSSPTLPEPPARSARVGLRIAAASAIVICVSVVALQRASQAGAAKPARTTANEAVREETPLAPSSTLGVVSRAETAPEPPPAPSAKPRVSRQPPRPASTGGAAEPFPAQRK